MSKTEISVIGQEAVDAHRDRLIANIANKAIRHCRIGKVVEKYKRQYGPLSPQPIMPTLPESPWFPVPYDPPMYPLGLQVSRKCSCKPGSSCNNAACPYMPIVTCGTADRLGLDAYGA